MSAIQKVLDIIIAFSFATIILTSVIGSKTVTVLTGFDFDLIYCILCLEDVKFGCTSNLLNELYTFWSHSEPEAFPNQNYFKKNFTQR